MRRPQLGLDFARSARVSPLVWMVLLLLLFAFTIALVDIWDASQKVALRRAERKQREVSEKVVTPPPRRNAEEVRLLRQEIKAVNRQIRQLNLSWDGLFNDLRSYPGGEINLLALEVDAHTNSVRITGVAPDVVAMADYAANLSDKKSLRSVLISRHELDAGGVRFVVDGKWAEKQ